MNLKDSLKKPKEPRQSKRFRFEFSMGGMLALAVILVLGVTWAFILGVLVGRGHRPEVVVPKLDKIMPETKAPVQAPPSQEALKPEDLQFYETLRKRPEGMPDQATVNQVYPPEKPKGKTKAEKEKKKTEPGDGDAAIVSGAEKHVAEAKPGEKAVEKKSPDSAKPVKETSSAAKPKTEEKKAQTSKPDKKESAKTAQADSKTKSEKKDKPEQAASKSTEAERKKAAPKTSEKPAAEKSSKKTSAEEGIKKISGDEGEKAGGSKSTGDDSDNRRYDYVYQVASLEEQSKAEEKKAELKKAGISSSVEKVVLDGKTWYRVSVSFRGRPVDTRELKEKLQQHGVKKALLRSKKPI